ncbi:MAG: plastocyanin/azurin family copper-binding protein [Candidatus Nitrosotenuis sp.]
MDTTIKENMLYYITHWGIRASIGAISVKDPSGNVIYKTTTAHSHVGVMNLDLAFPTAGQNTISLTTSSIGMKMMGMDVPAMARTHTMLSGDPMEGWKKDPDNDFGTRTYEFPVIVLSEKQVKTVQGSEKDTSLNIEMAANSDQIVAGQPITLVFTVTNAKDGSMVTHPDMLLKVRTGSMVTVNSAPSGGMMIPMNGAYHGHTGVMTYTTTFPRAGQYTLNLDLNSLPVSNLMFGSAQARFVLNVAEAAGGDNIISTTTASSGPNTVNIVGMEAPFYAPNSINVKAGTTLTFVNVDGNMHTVTTVKKGTTEPDGRIDSGLIKAGETFTAKFATPGTYDYFCAIHTGMKGTVNVS